MKSWRAKYTKPVKCSLVISPAVSVSNQVIYFIPFPQDKTTAVEAFAHVTIPTLVIYKQNTTGEINLVKWLEKKMFSSISIRIHQNVLRDAIGILETGTK